MHTVALKKKKIYQTENVCVYELVSFLDFG